MQKPTLLFKFSLAGLIIGVAAFINACGGSATAQPAPAPAQAVTPTIEVLFRPGDKVADRIVLAIDNAQKNIKVQAYSFTNVVITNALIRAKQRGVDVQLIEDDGDYHTINGATKPKIDQLKAAGVLIYLDNSHSIAHNKIVIIDALEANPVVITGSYNFSQAAENSNAENIVVLGNNPAVATAYLNNWITHQGHSPLLP
jgi:phosphatidylserine/phosphatidylglycerophosphate/cardiolipin synthase-like enzyme